LRAGNDASRKAKLASSRADPQPSRLGGIPPGGSRGPASGTVALLKGAVVSALEGAMSGWENETRMTSEEPQRKRSPGSIRVKRARGKRRWWASPPGLHCAPLGFSGAPKGRNVIAQGNALGVQCNGLGLDRAGGRG